MLCLQFWVSTDINWNKIIGYTSTIFTIIQVSFSFITVQFDVTDKVFSHKETANQYRQLRDEYLILIGKLHDNIPNINYHSLEILQLKYDMISNNSPDTNVKNAYESTQTKLGTNGNPNEEFYTWSNEEINNFLPENYHL